MALQKPHNPDMYAKGRCRQHKANNDYTSNPFLHLLFFIIIVAVSSNLTAEFEQLCIHSTFQSLMAFLWFIVAQIAQG